MRVKYSRSRHNAKETSFTSPTGAQRQCGEQEHAQFCTNHDVTSGWSCRRPENVSILSSLLTSDDGAGKTESVCVAVVWTWTGCLKLISTWQAKSFIDGMDQRSLENFKQCLFFFSTFLLVMFSCCFCFVLFWLVLFSFSFPFVYFSIFSNPGGDILYCLKVAI